MCIVLEVPAHRIFPISEVSINRDGLMHRWFSLLEVSTNRGCAFV